MNRITVTTGGAAAGAFEQKEEDGNSVSEN